jgi:hypothetical protein
MGVAQFSGIFKVYLYPSTGFGKSVRPNTEAGRETFHGLSEPHFSLTGEIWEGGHVNILVCAILEGLKTPDLHVQDSRKS